MFTNLEDEEDFDGMVDFEVHLEFEKDEDEEFNSSEMTWHDLPQQFCTLTALPCA